MKTVTIEVSQEQLDEMKKLMDVDKDLTDEECVYMFVETNVCMDREGENW
jgi:hypothetical protein